MSKKWRIKQEINYAGNRFILQKRLLGFLWWYNPDNIDGAITGVYDSLCDAREAYEQKTTKTKIVIIEI